jgi:hypothetical protein
VYSQPSVHGGIWLELHKLDTQMCLAALITLTSEFLGVLASSRLNAPMLGLFSGVDDSEVRGDSEVSGDSDVSGDSEVVFQDWPDPCVQQESSTKRQGQMQRSVSLTSRCARQFMPHFVQVH